jgi:cell cycle checkpoint protein
MWVEKHTPTVVDELCVAQKKVKEVRSWLIKTGETPMPSVKLLVLVGSSGIGKSTMIRVLAKELGYFVCDWNESVAPYSNSHGREESSQSYDPLLSIESTSPLQSFEEFLQQSGAGLQSLSLKSSNVGVFSASTKSATTTKSITTKPCSTTATSSKSLILLEDLPHLNDVYAELRFRSIMDQHLSQTRVPTVLIFSDVSEGKHRPKDLERLINPRLLYSQDITQIVQIHSVTKPRMKKLLSGIAKREKVQIPSASSLWDELHDQSRGDLRHAILTLQLESAGRREPCSTMSKQKNDRDFKLTSFHALGKLLYAKRTSNPVSGRQILAYDPEDTMERSDMGLGGSIGFLEYHSVDFYTDITDLSNAFDLFSDASLMLDYPMDVRCFRNVFRLTLVRRCASLTEPAFRSNVSSTTVGTHSFPTRM